jgi:hypothetical protein
MTERIIFAVLKFRDDLYMVTRKFHDSYEVVCITKTLAYAEEVMSALVIVEERKHGC